MPSLGPTELIIILVIVLLIFGPGKLANLGGSLGKSIKDFRRGMQNEDASDEGESAPLDAKAELKSTKKAEGAKLGE
jgi:sec-independent protein translocase protein TatA